MLLLALTGSLATGKSTVSAILSSPPYSLPLIDADVLAREVVQPGQPAYKKIVKHFLPTTPDLLLPWPEEEKERKADMERRREGTLGEERPLNRAALGRRVFGNEPERVKDRKILNGIVHPAVRWAMVKRILYYYLTAHWAVLLDIPLLYDSGLDIFTSAVIMVAVSDPEIQMQRLRARDPHLSAQEAADRVRSQGGVTEKVERTKRRGNGRGWVAWNDSGKEELQAEVRRVMGKIEGAGLLGRKGIWRWAFWLCPPLAAGWGIWEIWREWRGRKRWEAEKQEEGKKGD